MSTYLYALGRAAYRHRRRVLLLWLAAVVLTVGAAAGIGDKFDENFSVPGTESQLALDSLNRTFPQAGGTTAQVVVVVPEGESVRSAENRRQIEAGVETIEQVAHVDSAMSPFDEYAKGVISADRRAAIITVQLELVDGAVADATFDGLDEATKTIAADIPGSQVSPGGAA